MGHNAIHDAGAVLDRLARRTSPREVDVDGLVYREGLNAVGISGGIAGNVIPDRCAVEVNYRFAPDRSCEQAQAHVRQVFDGLDLVVTDAAAGARPGSTHPAAAAFVAAIGRGVAPKYGWTDVARFGAMGVPAVNYGPGDPRWPTRTTSGARPLRSWSANVHCAAGSPTPDLAPDLTYWTSARVQDVAMNSGASRRLPTYHKGPVTLRGRMVPKTTTDQRLLDARDTAAWVHPDPWRVMRIQAEFVEGFGALAELGPAISVFGSARTPRDHPNYALGRAGGAPAGRGRLRRDHRRRPGHDGGRQQGGQRGRRGLGRARASSCRTSRA